MFGVYLTGRLLLRQNGRLSVLDVIFLTIIAIRRPLPLNTTVNGLHAFKSHLVNRKQNLYDVFAGTDLH